MVGIYLWYLCMVCIYAMYVFMVWYVMNCVWYGKRYGIVLWYVLYPWYGVVWYMVWYGMVYGRCYMVYSIYDIVFDGMLGYGTVWVWYGIVWYGRVWYGWCVCMICIYGMYGVVWYGMYGMVFMV